MCTKDFQMTVTYLLKFYALARPPNGRLPKTAHQINRQLYILTNQQTNENEKETKQKPTHKRRNKCH